jgi:predicted RNA-binding protein with RPS1 domain
MRRKTMEVTYEKGKWNELIKELEIVVKENNIKPKKERKSLSVVFKEFAEKHNTTASSAQFYYYNDVKPKLEEKTIDIDESINNYANSITTDLRDPRSVYKVGDILEIEVISIQDFGVFGKTKEGFEGLIHISEITGKHYVDLPEDYFYVGEKVKVKIKRIDNEGKLGFSTRAIGGKEKINPVFKDIAQTTVQDVARITVTPKVEKIEPVKVEQPKQEEVKPMNPVNSNDRDNIIEFIKRYSDNSVSQKALSDIDEMISNFGVFQTTMSLLEAIRDLDLSSYITESTMEKLTSGERLRRD